MEDFDKGYERERQFILLLEHRISCNSFYKLEKAFCWKDGKECSVFRSTFSADS
jgi:hypothetical protein